MPIFDFNTPATVGALGAAVSQINQQVLRQIGVTIQIYEREQLAERSVTHGEQPDLHDERRLSDSRPEADRTAGEAPGQVREDAQSVSAYAIPAMQWAGGAGIVNGSNGKLNPQNNATRAEVATMLMRYCEKVAK